MRRKHDPRQLDLFTRQSLISLYIEVSEFMRDRQPIFLTDAKPPVEQVIDYDDVVKHNIRSEFAFVGSDGEFSGYAYLWDAELEAELSPGSFLDSLEKRWPKMLLQHDATQPIGKWLEIIEDEKGLWVKGQIDMNTEKGRETASLMQSRALDGMSIGYLGIETTEQSGKVLTSKVALYEISIVTFPAVENAVVDTVALSDRLVVDANSVRPTNDGYLVASARAARAGIQLYRGAELGHPEKDIVKVYRPADEVFKTDSLRTYGHKPMTNNHPPVPVTADNWKTYSVGQIGEEVIKDGEFVRVPMLLMDKAGINDFQAGKKELSLGYTTDLVWGEGKTPDGQTYDAMQTNIRANHLALVSAARGGPELRIGDDKGRQEEPTMTNLKDFVVDGINVQMTDVAAQVVQRAMKALTDGKEAIEKELSAARDKVTELAKKLSETEEEAKKTKDTADAKIAMLEKQVADSKITPQQLNAMVKDRAVVVGKAATFLKVEPSTLSDKSDAELRKMVVSKHLGDACKDWNDDKIDAAFAMVKVGDGATPPAYDRLGAILADGSYAADVTAIDTAYAARDKALENAWMTPVK